MLNLLPYRAHARQHSCRPRCDSCRPLSNTRFNRVHEPLGCTSRPVNGTGLPEDAIVHGLQQQRTLQEACWLSHGRLYDAMMEIHLEHASSIVMCMAPVSIICSFSECTVNSVLATVGERILEESQSFEHAPPPLVLKLAPSSSTLAERRGCQL